ncbi:MAG: hypothetical protein DCC68_18240 [Planctomycetota bacterium]|nr:MAG: hypothetical protein DCC68_18240 [Planctomycetota bacterium]
MAKQTVAGISGVLGGLISTGPSAAPAERPVSVEHRAERHVERPAPSANVAAVAGPREPRAKPSARRGRPPGRLTGSAPHKAKVTLRVDATLMDDYREWSWSERCQLGELVERALANYRRLRA